MTYAVIGGTLVALVIGAIWIARAWGREKAERDALETAKERKDAQLRVARPSDRDVSRSLRDGRF